MNQPTPSQSLTLTSYEFISEMRKCLATGQRFTPFFGSGISAQSGILMGREFPDYIAYTVYRVLGGKSFEPGTDQADLSDRKPHWDIRSRGWPPYPNNWEIDDAYEFIYRLYVCLEHERCSVVTKDPSARRKEITQVRPIGRTTGNDGVNTGDADLFRALVPGILRSSDFDEEETRLDAKRRHMKIRDEISDPNIPSSSRSYIDSAAIRSLSHWTRSLEFLCRVAVTPGLTPRLYLDAPDVAVIDSFNAYITHGKKPNLIHNMVARLSRSLRSQVLLTTNFDTLIEESYRAQGEPLHVLAVSIRGGLPSYATVRAQDCLIKLHGDILETRADSTINDPPTDRDKGVFFQYLRGPNDPAQTQPKDFAQSHLLVLGYSGNDARCVQMIRHVLDLDPQFRVFWVCHGERDRERISRLFGDYIRPFTGSATGQFVIYQTDRSDLFLWELYQQVNLSLPGGGYNVQFNHFVPPISNDDESKYQSEAFREQIELQCKEIDRITQTSVALVDTGSSTARPMQACFYNLRNKWKEAAWIELEDYRNTDDLFFNLLSIISQRIGQFQLEWTNFAPRYYQDKENRRFEPVHMQRRLELLIEKYKIAPSCWYLFLYGRNGAGGCSGWTKKPEYWNSLNQNEYSENFTKLLGWLLKLGFRIVYMPHGMERQKHAEGKITEIIDVASSHPLFSGLEKMSIDGAIPPPTPDIDEMRKSIAIERLADFPSGLHKGVTGKKFKDMITLVLRDFFPAKNSLYDYTRGTRAVWLYGMTLIRQSRHPSMLISEAVFPCPWKYQMNEFDVWHLLDASGENIVNELKDNDELRFWFVFKNSELSAPDAAPNKYHEHRVDIDYKGWMNTLVDHGLFLRKPGGYSWMYRDARLGLQSLFEQVSTLEIYAELFPSKIPCGSSPEALSVPGGFKSLRPRLHFWIGEWYLRAFYATGHYMPLVEAIYHSVQCLDNVSDYQKPSRKDDVTKTSESNSESENDVQIEKKYDPETQRKFEKLGYAWIAICQIRKLIRVGRKSFLFWCPGVDIATVFFAAGSKPAGSKPLPSFKEIINGWKENEDLKPTGGEVWIERFVSACDALKEEIEHLRDAVEAEGYAHGGRSSPIAISPKAPPIAASLHATNDHGSVHIGILDRKWYEPIFEKMKPFLKGISTDSDVFKLLDIESEDLPPWDFDRTRNSQINGTEKKEDPNIQHGHLRGKLLKHFLNSGPQPGNGTVGEAAVFEFSWLLSELMYRLARRAKILGRSQNTKLVSEVANCWRTISALGNTSLSLCRNLPPEYHQADCDLRVRILTVYAVALGYLNRFSEAARRFNEAHALIISGMETTNGRDLARIHIRRAEMLILRARWKMGKIDHIKLGDEYQLVIIHVDEAWSAIERGELGLGGNSHSTYWWHRLLALKLSCYATLGELCEALNKPVGLPFSFEHCLPFRRRLHLPSMLMSLTRDALIVAAGDDFRQLEIINDLLSASKLIPEDNGKERFFGTTEELGLLFTMAPEGKALLSDVVRVFYDDENLGIIEPGNKNLKNTNNELRETLGKYTEKLWSLIPNSAQRQLEAHRETMGESLSSSAP